jgi:uncharacterized membrane protein YbhN (UPF0104 family)
MKVNLKIRFLVTLGLLVCLAWRTNMEQLREAVLHLRAGFWLLALGLYLIVQMISGFRWQLLSRPLGFRNSVVDCIRFYFIGMFFNLFLPTSVGGDVVRAWYLDSGSRRKASALLTVLVDRVSGLIVLLALGCMGTALCPIPIATWIVGSVWGAAGLGLVGLVLAPILLEWASRSNRNRILTKQLVVYFHRPRLILGTTSLSLAIQGGNVILVWLVGLAIEAPVPASYYWIMVPMVTLLTMMPLSLNGMGVREGGTILFLSPLGVPHATAFSLALLWFAVFTTASLLGGLLYLIGGFSKPAGLESSETEWKAAA